MIIAEAIAMGAAGGRARVGAGSSVRCKGNLRESAQSVDKTCQSGDWRSQAGPFRFDSPFFVRLCALCVNRGTAILAVIGLRVFLIILNVAGGLHGLEARAMGVHGLAIVYAEDVRARGRHLRIAPPKFKWDKRQIPP